MKGLNPARDGDLFDFIVFAGTDSPGVVVLSGHEREQNLDVKASDGQKGATTTWKGEKPGEFTATFRLNYEPLPGVDDFTAWDDFAELLKSTIPPASGSKPVAKDVYHPDLARNGYNAVILKKMGAMAHDGRGGATIAVVLSEYYPPKPAAVGAPKKAKTKDDPNDPIVQATKELNDLKKEAFGP